jgi:hypothetical protein
VGIGFVRFVLLRAPRARVQQQAARGTIALFEQTGSPVIGDGEQAKPSFATYPLSGLHNLAPDGVVIPFADGPVVDLNPIAHAGGDECRKGILCATRLSKCPSFPSLFINYLSCMNMTISICANISCFVPAVAKATHGPGS